MRHFAKCSRTIRRTDREQLGKLLAGWPRARILIEASTESEWVARVLGECCKKFLSTPDIVVASGSLLLLVVAKIFFATLPSKIGNGRLRKALYFPAVTALRCSPFFQEWAEGLRRRGKSKMAVIGAAMRKLIHLAYGVLKTGKPFDPEWAKTT